MKKLLLTFLLSYSVLILNARSRLDSTYIKLEYIGLVFKPLYQIFFYYDKTLDGFKPGYGYSFKITKGEFQLIENAIKQQSLRDSSQSSFYYEFTILNNKKKFVRQAMNKISIQEMFNSILNQLNEGETKNTAKKAFATTLGRLD
jgi:hypothetical protein